MVRFFGYMVQKHNQNLDVSGYPSYVYDMFLKL